jgi:RHS repeat-associated protein
VAACTGRVPPTPTIHHQLRRCLAEQNSSRSWAHEAARISRISTVRILRSYTWDFENHLTRAAYPSTGIETYSYAADGKRRQKVTAGGTANFVWDRENVLSELDANLATQAQYTQFPGIWGGLASQRRSGVSSYYGFDLAGSTRALVSGAGAITDTYTYKAFGPELLSGGSTANPQRYCAQLGYYRDNSTRQYVRARHLRADSGRWMSQDPVGISSNEPNLYRYAANQPLAGGDPAGRLSERGDKKGFDAEKAQKFCEAVVKFLNYGLKFLPEEVREKLHIPEEINENICKALCLRSKDENACLKALLEFVCGKLPFVLNYGCTQIVIPILNQVSVAAANTDHINHPKTNADCWLYAGSQIDCGRCCNNLWDQATQEDEYTKCYNGCVKFFPAGIRITGGEAVTQTYATIASVRR